MPECFLAISPLQGWLAAIAATVAAFLLGWVLFGMIPGNTIRRAKKEADQIQRAAAAGVVALIQPGGSKRDEEVIAACNQHRLPMIFTGRRHFKH